MKKLFLRLMGLFRIQNKQPESTAFDEPLFINIKSSDSELKQAHAMAAATLEDFQAQVKEQRNVIYMAKLKFKDPDLSEELGKDQYLYMWLNNVYYHEEEKLFSGMFFEVPQEMQKWHQVGDRLGFESDDIYDWMINENGKVKGAFTILVNRSRLKTDQEKKQFDEFLGISEYEALN